MAKLKHPLLSFEAHRSVGDALTFQHRGGVDFVRKKPIPSQPNTDLQRWHRLVYLDACKCWAQLSALDKQAYNTSARPFRMSGFNLFLRERLDLASNLALWLPLCEGSGIVTADYSGKDRPCALSTPSWVSSYPGGSLQFNGTTDRAVVPAFNGLSFTAFTFWLMFRAPGFTGAWRSLAIWWQTATMRFFITLHRTLNYMNIEFTLPGYSAFWAPTFTPDTWTQAGFTWDGTTAYLVKNGVLLLPKPITGTFNPAANLILGMENWVFPYNGLLGEVKAYDCILTPTQAAHDFLAVDFKY